MKKITQYILDYWYFYVFAIICMVISIILDMLSPLITGIIIDDVIDKGKIELLTMLLVSIFFIGIGRSIFGYLKEFTFDHVGIRIAKDMRKNLFNHIQTLSINYFDNTNTGELMARVKDDIDMIWNSLGFVGMLIIEVFIHTGIVLFCMYRINWKLALIPTIIIPVIGILAVVMERKLGKIYEEISEETASLNTVAEENISGVRTVKAFAREKHEISKFLRHNKRYYDLNMTHSKVFVRYYPYFQITTKLLPFLILLFGGFLVIEKEITIGDLSAFTFYSMNIVWPMEMLGWLTNDFSAAVASNKKIKRIYAQESSIKEAEVPIELNPVKGKIAFEHVYFSHDDKEVLSDISFTIEQGNTLGIMGATGAGKSSIIQLLQRQYDAQQGNIKLDDINIKELTLKNLRENISLVMQDVFLFSETVRENIKLGKKNNLDDSTVFYAAHQAQAGEFIERMDKGYETVIGERGVGLSGGQKQRISIARAIAKKTPILVLDDSTSALDMETESFIQKSLLSLTQTTKLIIAHRISAVRYANEIIFLKNGKIAERGTHEELLAKKGLYYETYLAQYGEYLQQNA